MAKKVYFSVDGNNYFLLEPEARKLIGDAKVDVLLKGPPLLPLKYKYKKQ